MRGAVRTRVHRASTRGHDGHEHMIADFRRRFWVSRVLTVPILLLSPLIQRVLSIEEVLDLPSDMFVLFGLSTFVFLYGGWPFLSGFVREVTSRAIGM